MPWYKTGTVSATLNSNAVTGTGTSFIANCRVGDAFRGPDGRWYEVTNVASNTAISIDPAYLGTTVSAGSYALAPMQGYVKDSADALRSIVNTYGAQLAALKTTGNYDVLPVSKGGTGGTDQPTARSGLGLGTAAVATVQANAADVTAGRLLAVGARGWNGGNGMVQANTVDANTLTTSGCYIFNAGGTNLPESSCYINVFTHTIAGYLKQIATGLLTNNHYERTCVNNTWGSWEVLVRTAISGAVPVSQGGTGGTTQATARSGIGAAALGANGDITSLTGLTTALSIAQGGTGATSGAAALTALGMQAGTYSPRFASQRAASGSAGALLSLGGGLYLGWNESSGGGEANFVNNMGGGTGGFTWRTVNNGNTATGPAMTYSYAGALTVPGTVSQGSDRRLKTNDVEILDGLEKIMQVRPVEFDRRDFLDSEDYPHHEVGVIAQELFEVVPLLVTPANPESAEDIWRVNYTGLIPYLVSAIKTLKSEIEELKAAAQ